MFGSVLFTVLLFSLPAAYFLVPRGTLFHELLHLPPYWWKLYRMDTSHLQPIRIAYGDHHRQYLLFIPPKPGAERSDKMIVYFHGGGWKFGKPEKFTTSILPFHEAGYPVVIPSHRRTPYYNYYDLREDLNQILLSILTLQQENGWAGQRIVLGGMSAGGNLAALLGLDHRTLGDLGVQPSIFAGLLVCGAPLALEEMQDSLILRAFAGKRGSKQFKSANPIEHLQEHGRALPVYCLHGRRDGMVDYRSSRVFMELLGRIQKTNIHFTAPEQGTHLEAAAWGHTHSDLRREILTWLRKL